MARNWKFLFLAVATFWGNAALCFLTPDEHPQPEKIEKPADVKKALSEKVVEKLNEIKSSIASNMMGLEAPFRFQLLNGQTFAFDNVEWFIAEDGHLKANLSPISVIEADGNQRQISITEFDELAEGKGKSVSDLSSTVMVQLADGSKVMCDLDYDEEEEVEGGEITNHLLADAIFVFPTNDQSWKDAMMQNNVNLFFVMDDKGKLRQVATL